MLFSTIVALAGAALSTASPIAAPVNLSRRDCAGGATSLIAFGDSLTDNGNFYVALNKTYPPSPPYYQGHFTNGLVWAEVVANTLNLNLQDYAYGGATTDSTFVPPFIPSLPGALQQVQLWLSAKPTITCNQIFSLWIGANDYFQIFEKNLTATVSDVVSHL
ncbi:hypothetical protein HDU76_012235, partial [Blyttiomyces sp. JEL0837]